VVVLTMLASLSFDPRMTWDDAPVEDPLTENTPAEDRDTKRNGQIA